MSETILSTCETLLANHGGFSPSLAVRNSIRSSQSESRASEVHFTLDICDVPRPRPGIYSFVFLSDVPSAPVQEVVLQVEEEGMISAVVGDEMQCDLQNRPYP